jgi:hypothetical protein
VAYLTESAVRAAAARRTVLAKADSILTEEVVATPMNATFDVFLCHAFRDAPLVLGAKAILEEKGYSVYVDWIIDPKLDRAKVNSGTAQSLRVRMQHSESLLYLYTSTSQRSRWMPWELGYFDARNGNVAILPIKPDGEQLDFSREEYLGLYPKVELEKAELWVNRTQGAPVSGDDKANYKSLRRWLTADDKLRPLNP